MRGRGHDLHLMCGPNGNGAEPVDAVKVGDLLHHKPDRRFRLPRHKDRPISYPKRASNEHR